jgi:bifunctional non-homologous end joining protein LigD
VLDPRGVPKFSLLQQRGALHSPIDIKKMAVELPSTFFAFDMMAFEDLDLRNLPLVRRKTLLAQVVPKLGPVRYLDHIEKEGEAFLASVTKLGLEGMIAKKADAPYRAGRTNQWLKIKAEQTADFVIVGFTRPEGTRNHFGALQLADYVNGQLVYAGRVGTGFTDALLDQIGEMLAPIVRETPPCVGPIFEGESEPRAVIPEIKTTTWVEPLNVVEVRYREWTPDGLLRHAALLHMRPDKPPRECVRQEGPGSLVLGPVPSNEDPGPTASASGISDPGPKTQDPGPSRGVSAEEPTPPPRAATPKSFNYSNLSKVYWPIDRYTKGDMIEYYRAVSPWLLPYLRNRPLVMTRYPDGIDGKMFYQKDAPEFAPDWIRTVKVWSEDTQREINYFVVDDEESLLYVANLGTIPVHIWASSVGSLELCDWCVIDLDPKDAPFKDVITCAQVLHRICESAGLPHYVKTTGKTGLHIMIPLGAQCTYEQSRQLGELLARLVLRETAEIATITRHVTKRGTKVYLDYLQNRHGQTIVAPFSVRPLPGATVSMPLEWSEVVQGLDPKNFTIKNAVERMEKLGVDPVRRVLEEKPDLGEVLGRLAGALSP